MRWRRGMGCRFGFGWGLGEICGIALPQGAAVGETTERMSGIAAERVHWTTRAPYFAALAAKTRSRGAVPAIVDELAPRSAKGATTTGMIAETIKICADADPVLKELRTAREAGHKPNRGIGSCS